MDKPKPDVSGLVEAYIEAMEKLGPPQGVVIDETSVVQDRVLCHPDDPPKPLLEALIGTNR